MSQQPSNNSSSTTMHDIITEEAPPAYSPFPNSGEQSMAFGLSRAFETTPYQSPQQIRPSASIHIYSGPSNSYYQTTQQPVIYQQVSTNPPPLPPRNNTASTSNLTLRYPAGYTCSTCNNTGYIRQRTKCQQCWKSFAVPNVIYTSPGNPVIGGRLCTHCRGSGRVSLLFIEDLCPRCSGVGRVFT
ncbi:8980_t:CDS:2 [Racocetra persica]|uniref:8980_t:CDS:1 n=1 Tax=Racocetra persica TaxID=160502 RepID=A0ACA9LHJ9_9GLOM|nr:8980_t:CDS:2 [Racocetra persica]